MSITLVFELVAFAIFWLVMPSIAPGAKLLGCAAGFLVGAGYGLVIIFVFSQKPFWSPLASMLLVTLMLVQPSHLFSRVAFIGDLLLGMFFILAGSARGRKSPPGKGPFTEVSPPQ